MNSVKKINEDDADHRTFFTTVMEGPFFSKWDLTCQNIGVGSEPLRG